MNERYDDGRDADTVPDTAKPRGAATAGRGATVAGRGATTTARAPEPAESSREMLGRIAMLPVQWMTIPLFAAFVFGICGMLAAASVEFAMREFATEGGVNRLIFVAVPGLFAMMFALIVYQNADQRIERVGQSLSRGILVAILTWIAFSLLATWVWGAVDFWRYFSNVLLITGVIGGGPMLAAALIAGAVVGWLIKQRRLGWIMTD
jgi:hypothetical protein